MLFRSVAVLAFAAQALARDAQPYKAASLAKMSLHQMGLVRRQESTDGYIPEQTVCGAGETCEQACGAGYQMCDSLDESIHCYNPAANEACCPNASGNSCQAGYYCTQDTAKDTWCCPNGMGLAECAAKFTARGSLISLTPTPSSTSALSAGQSSNPLTTAGPNGSQTTRGPSVTGGASGRLSSSTTAAVPNAGPTAGPVLNGAVLAVAGAFVALL